MRAVPSLVIFAAMLAVCPRAGRAESPSAEAGAALTEDECRAIWNTGAGRSGFFGPDGAQPYVDDFPAVDTNRDNKISNAEFIAGCKAGLVHTFKPKN